MRSRDDSGVDHELQRDRAEQQVDPEAGNDREQFTVRRRFRERDDRARKHVQNQVPAPVDTLQPISTREPGDRRRQGRPQPPFR